VPQPRQRLQSYSSNNSSQGSFGDLFAPCRRIETVMATHKVLKSVVRSVADSFTSLMNYADDDYVMGHVLTVARATGKNRLDIDLLTGVATPEELLTAPVTRAISRYHDDFPQLVERSGADFAFVTTARLLLEFDTSVARAVAGFPQRSESPYRCHVELIDDRDHVYEITLDGWWFPEPPPTGTNKGVGRRRP
jgi:hypothetical protein